jgi:hypothetical protein
MNLKNQLSLIKMTGGNIITHQKLTYIDLFSTKDTYKYYIFLLI